MLITSQAVYSRKLAKIERERVKGSISVKASSDLLIIAAEAIVIIMFSRCALRGCLSALIDR